MYLSPRHAMFGLFIASLLSMSTDATNTTNSTSSNTTDSSLPAKFWFKEILKEQPLVRKVAMSVSAVGAVLNTAVIVIIVIDPLKVLRKGPWITILNLATADLITCIAGFFLFGQEYITYKGNELYINTFFFLWAFGYSGSFLMLTFFTLQIFIITKYPMKSRYWLTTRKILLFGMGFWLLTVPLGLSNLAYLHFHWKESLKIYIVRISILEVATIVQIILNIKVVMEIIKSGRVTAGNAQTTKHKNIAKTVIILTLILFFTAFPYFLLRQLEYLARLEYFGQSETGQILYAISYCYIPIAILNFVANPVLYSLRLPDYRNSLLAFVGKGRRKTDLSRGTTQKTSSFAFSLQNVGAS